MTCGHRSPRWRGRAVTHGVSPPGVQTGGSHRRIQGAEDRDRGGGEQGAAEHPGVEPGLAGCPEVGQAGKDAHSMYAIADADQRAVNPIGSASPNTKPMTASPRPPDRAGGRRTRGSARRREQHGVRDDDRPDRDCDDRRGAVRGRDELVVAVGPTELDQVADAVSTGLDRSTRLSTAAIAFAFGSTLTNNSERPPGWRS